MTAIRYRTADVDGFKVFYREAGSPSAPKLLLLHGFPSSGHMFRDLIPLLADRFHVVAPGPAGLRPVRHAGPRRVPLYLRRHRPGDRPVHRGRRPRTATRSTCSTMARPPASGWRCRHPERIAAIISQNGNAYEEGLSDGWTPIQAYWQDPSAANREALRAFLTPETTRWQYVHGVDDERRVSPDGYTLDSHYLARPGADEVQLDLFLDYASNVALYPEFQAYFRKHRPPFLAVWGKNDPFFLPPGAEAFRRDLPDADIRFFDTGHFALETHARGDRARPSASSSCR